MLSKKDWKQLAAEAQEGVLAKIPAKWKLDKIPTAEDEPNACAYLDRILPENENAITSKSMVELIKELSAGKLTAVEVTEAFCHRAAYAHQLVGQRKHNIG
jgi:amidase